ncbi:MAG: hypothetical protein MUC98_12415, partial [Desulfobacterota bacterium]|nr:hypothetical protein [Thermodesulfobacteriota bacterium]
MLEHGLVVDVSPGDNDKIGGFVHRDFFEHAFKWTLVDLGGIGEFRRISKFRTIVNDLHLESHPACQRDNLSRDMTSTEDIEDGIRKNRFHKKLDAPPEVISGNDKAGFSLLEPKRHVFRDL